MSSFDYTFKVILLGDPSTGKEDFVNRYISRVFQDDLNLTVGYDLIKRFENHGDSEKLKVISANVEKQRKEYDKKKEFRKVQQENPFNWIERKITSTLMGINRPGMNPNQFYWEKKDTKIATEQVKIHSGLKTTIGADFYTKDQEFREKIVRLQIWNFGGQERFRFLIHQYCKSANGAIIMYDITNRLSLDHIPDWIRIVRENAGDIPIILVGAKAHLEQFRAVSREEGVLTAKKYNLSACVELSSKTGENVEKTFAILTKTLIDYYKPKKEKKKKNKKKKREQKEKAKLEKEKKKKEKEGITEPIKQAAQPSMKTAKLRIEGLEPSRSGRILCYVDQTTMDNLGLATGDIVEIIGRKRTAGIVVASFADKGKEIIRIDGIQRLNLGSTIGEFVTIQPTLASPAIEIELAPTKEIYDIKKQADIIKGKLIDKPIMSGDVIDIPGAFIKTGEDNNPMNGFMRMLNIGSGSRRPTLGPLRLKVVNIIPKDEVVRFTRDTRIVLQKILKSESKISSPSHPKPPDDFEPAAQVQIRAPLKEKDPEDEVYCQYCGTKLTKGEQTTHSCKKKPE